MYSSTTIMKEKRERKEGKKENKHIYNNNFWTTCA
jgi:hypothetical protein